LEVKGLSILDQYSRICNLQYKLESKVKKQYRHMEINKITEKIIGCAIEVHKKLGPGLLESAYEECLSYELKSAGLSIQRQVPVPVVYKEIYLDYGYRIDILVENTVILELKSIEAFAPVHEAQILTYMKFAEKTIGLLINFNVLLLKDGIKRYKF